jgi:thiamine-monophosphate kinase
VAPDELAIIERYFRPLAGEGAFGLRDDAAQLSVPPDCDLVVTKDMIAVGTHFLPDDPPETIARKALRVNLSDLTAKGAKPLAYMLGAGFGRNVDEAWLAAFASGLRGDQQLFSIRLLGGDTISVAAGPVISITAFGAVPSGRMVHRFGGQPGDALYVSGTIGAAAAGLALLKGTRGVWDRLGSKAHDALVGRFRVPEPRVGLAAALTEFASAAMDVSDGLVGDCDKLAAASSCTATIEADRVPLPTGLAGSRDESLLAVLLTGGDDFEVLAAVPPRNEAGFTAASRQMDIDVTRIGSLREGQGMTEVLFEGRALSFQRRSFVHGRGQGT